MGRRTPQLRVKSPQRLFIDIDILIHW